VVITAGQLGYLLEGIDWRLPRQTRTRRRRLQSDCHAKFHDGDPEAWLANVFTRIAPSSRQAATLELAQAIHRSLRRGCLGP